MLSSGQDSAMTSRRQPRRWPTPWGSRLPAPEAVFGSSSDLLPGTGVTTIAAHAPSGCDRYVGRARVQGGRSNARDRCGSSDIQPSFFPRRWSAGDRPASRPNRCAYVPDLSEGWCGVARGRGRGRLVVRVPCLRSPVGSTPDSKYDFIGSAGATSRRSPCFGYPG